MSTPHFELHRVAFAVRQHLFPDQREKSNNSRNSSQVKDVSQRSRIVKSFALVVFCSDSLLFWLLFLESLNVSFDAVFFYLTGEGDDTGSEASLSDCSSNSTQRNQCTGDSSGTGNPPKPFPFH